MSAMDSDMEVDKYSEAPTREPPTSGSDTETSSEYAASSVKELEVLNILTREAELVKAVHSEIRQEFAEWKAGYIAGLGVGQIACVSRFKMPNAVYKRPPTPPPSDDPGIDCWEYDEAGNITSSYSIPVDVTSNNIDKPKFSPHPPYQFCTPASRNIMAKGIDNKSTPFAPYADDPKFPINAYMKQHESDQWEEHQMDPDDEIIQIELVRRLHVDHGLDVQTIDDIFTALPGLPELRVTNADGLLWEINQRDLLDVVWGDGVPSSEHVQLPPDFAAPLIKPTDPTSHEVEGSSDLLDAMNCCQSNFCANLNCVQSHCGVHVVPDSKLYAPKIKLQKPHLKSMDFFTAFENAKLEPCGEDCFYRRFRPNKKVEEEDIQDHDKNILFELRGVLKLNPDMLPCYLAVICRLPCWQAYAYRTTQLIKDKKVQRLPKKKGKKTRQEKRGVPKFNGELHSLLPCTHPGSCSLKEGCPCYMSGLACERNCQCLTSCRRRWPGCNQSCKKNTSCTFTEESACICRLAQRECDPELCTNCDARDEHIHFPELAHRTSRCENVEIQRGEYKRINVQKSKYGLGAFADENIQEGDCLGEYVGELMEADCDEARGLIRDHSGVNYSFSFADPDSKESGGLIVDSHRLGNPTRFLNDSKPNEPNCIAKSSRVNGEKRIVLFAGKKIKWGEELFLAYGETYWQKKKLQEAEKGEAESD